MLWSALRAMCTHPAVRATIFIPLIGYMILFNAKVSEFLQLVHEISGTESGDTVSWRLIFIYFGLIALSFGAIGYAIFCDAAVKYYGSADAYVNAWQNIMKDYALAEIEDKLRTSHYARQYEQIRAADEKVMYEKDLNERKSEMYNAYLHLYFKLLNERFPLIRWIVTALLLLGFLLLAIPSANVFYHVVLIMIAKVSQ
jgi:hypothetical protein